MASDQTSHADQENALDGTALSAAPIEIAVVGAGPVGLTTALLLAERAASHPHAGPVALIAPPERTGTDVRDYRTAAVFHQGCDLLRAAGAAETLFCESAALAGIRMIDISDRLLRAPDVMFRAAEVGLDAFGYNLANADIVRHLEAAAARAPGLRRITGRVVDAALQGAPDTDDVVLTLDTGAQIRARAVVAADGRHSKLRPAAGIATRQWSRGQAAITTQFAHSRPHGDISTELHDRQGPCTTVPLMGQRSSLVWMVREDTLESVIGDGNSAAPLQAALQPRVGGFLGAISDMTPPKAVPLLSLVARRMAARRVFLVGEAAHAFPPIGAQGLNLGFRDVADAVDVIGAAIERGSDPGAAAVTARYHALRWVDVEARSQAVDALNESLVSRLPFLPAARGLGLLGVSAVPPLRRLLMNRGMAGVSLPDVTDLGRRLRPGRRDAQSTLKPRGV